MLPFQFKDLKMETAFLRNFGVQLNRRAAKRTRTLQASSEELIGRPGSRWGI